MATDPFAAFSAAPGEKAAADQAAQLAQGYGDLTKQYGLGRGALTTDYAAALAPWTQQGTYAAQGQNALADYLGFNGPEGNARALAAFQNNPGYQFQLQQGMNAIDADAARRGQLASGNTDIDLMKYAQGLANQSWGQFGAQLAPFLGAGQTAATGIAGINTGLGNQMAANYTGLGQGQAAIEAAIGKAKAGGDLASYDASKNLIGAGLAVAGDVATAMGGGGGGGGKSLFGGFGAGSPVPGYNPGTSSQWPVA